MLIVTGGFILKSINLHSSRWQLCDSFFITCLAFIFSGLRASSFRLSSAIFSTLSTARPFSDHARAREFCGRRSPGAAELLDFLDLRLFFWVCPLASRYHPNISEGLAGVRGHRRRAVLGKEREKFFFRVGSTRCFIVFV